MTSKDPEYKNELSDSDLAAVHFRTPLKKRRFSRRWWVLLPLLVLGVVTFYFGIQPRLDARADLKKETAILKYLYRAGERVVTRDVLLHEVWGYNAGVTTHTLETHIYRLRQKIEKDPSQAELLITETGGYKLVP